MLSIGLNPRFYFNRGDEQIANANIGNEFALFSNMRAKYLVVSIIGMCP